MKWEYLTVYLNPADNLREQLTHFGEGGWELVTTFKWGGTSSPCLIFKREKVHVHVIG